MIHKIKHSSIRHLMIDTKHLIVFRSYLILPLSSESIADKQEPAARGQVGLSTHLNVNACRDGVVDGLYAIWSLIASGLVWASWVACCLWTGRGLIFVRRRVDGHSEEGLITLLTLSDADKSSAIVLQDVTYS